MAGRRITLGSLFDGIGVFPLAALRNRIIPIWASEIEKAPVSITTRHFSCMKHLGDITKLHGGKIPPVDIITFGSPCQDLSSMRGNRQGLDGSKSSLFYEAIRIIDEMKEATHGIYPTFSVWENVAGAFSSNDRLDFKAVLESFTKAEVPMPANRWAYSGMVRDNGFDLAWRQLDAQYWGRPNRIPQRRKRIFLVCDYTGERAAQILFNPGAVQENIGPGENEPLQHSPGIQKDTGSAGRVMAAPVRHKVIGYEMRDEAQFLSCFGKPGDPANTLLCGKDSNMVAVWDETGNGVIRYYTPLEMERLMGLPDDWTAYGHKGETISDTARYKALGNAIVLPCAEYIMQGIARALEA